MYTEQDSLWKALLAEFLGTFSLVFLGASAASVAIEAGASLLSVAFAFGLALMMLIYVFGPYSGSHLNPSVSFGFAVSGQMNWGLMLVYWLMQILGALAGAALSAYFFGPISNTTGTLASTDAWKAILLTALLTFFLVITYLFIYRNPMLAIVSGLVIGLVLTLVIIVGGPLTGGSINPAQSIGTAIFTNNWSTIWIFIIGPLLGALIAALVYKLFTVNFDCCYKVDDCGKRLKDDCGNCLMTCKRPCLDKCGKPIVDECGNPKMEEVEVLEQHYGFKQETYKKEAMAWFHKHGIDERHLQEGLKSAGACDTCGPSPIMHTETITVVSQPAEMSLTGVPVAPFTAAQNVPLATPISPLMSNAASPSTVAINDIRSSTVNRSAVPQGIKTPVAVQPYTMQPRY